jgi:DNA-directed RNA polymerase specialized sigma subunit
MPNSEINKAYKDFMDSVNERKKEIENLRKQGFTWKEIGTLLGITRQRAQQIYGKK